MYEWAYFIWWCVAIVIVLYLLLNVLILDRYNSNLWWAGTSMLFIAIVLPSPYKEKPIQKYDGMWFNPQPAKNWKM